MWNKPDSLPIYGILNIKKVFNADPTVFYYDKWSRYL